MRNQKLLGVVTLVLLVGILLFLSNSVYDDYSRRDVAVVGKTITSPVTNPEIKVMTYNVRYGCGSHVPSNNYVGNYCPNGVHSDEAINAIFNLISQNDPDILVLQEVWGKTRDNLKSMLTNYKSVWSPTEYAIFIKKEGEFIGSSTQGIKIRNRPVYIRQKVNVKGQEIIVYNVHLSRAVFPTGDLNDNQKICAWQNSIPDLEYEKTREGLNALRNQAGGEESGTKVILAGDYNYEDVEAYLSTFENLVLNSPTFPTKKYCRGKSGQYLFGGFFEDEQIDHILVSSNFKILVGGTFGDNLALEASDHFPVYATLQLEAVEPQAQAEPISTQAQQPAPTTTPPASGIQTAQQPAATPTTAQPVVTTTPSTSRTQTAGLAPATSSQPYSSAGARASTAPTQPYSPPSRLAASACLRCVEIDDVWQKVRSKIVKPTDEAFTKVWDVDTNSWQSFNVVYPSKISISEGVNLNSLGLRDKTYAQTLVDEARKQGIHPCYPLVTAKHESGGNAKAVVAEANLAICSSTIRARYLNEINNPCKNKGVNEIKELCAGKNGRIRPPADTNDECLKAFMDTNRYGVKVPQSNELVGVFCKEGFKADERFAIGLGQINVYKDQSEREIAGKKYSACQLLDPIFNAEATVRLLKSNGAGQNPTENEIRKTFANYGGGGTDSDSVTNRFNSFMSCLSSQ
jgi:endonuclease/exonuclease/phosphatase family metal-dependent hydrolase